VVVNELLDLLPRTAAGDERRVDQSQLEAGEREQDLLGAALVIGSA